jgi:PGF-pre-PGF domain-containing protein
MKKSFLAIIILALLLMPTALATGNVKINDFSSNVTNGTIPVHTRFTANVTGNITYWRWSFINIGTGATTVSGANITTHHNFGKVGVYNVTLFVYGPEGSDTLTKVAYVTANADTSDKSVASFSASPTTGKAPLKVTFTDKSSGTPTSWSWNFGDGSTSAEKNPVHNYSAAGNYTVNMTVTNQNGIDSKTQEIIVQGEPGQEKVIPVADFSSDVASGYAPLNVQFTDLSKNANSWNWDFGDGTNSAEQGPAHIYSSPGNYTVTLTANNENGNSSKTAVISVLQGTSDGSSDSSNSGDNGGSSDSDNDESSHRSHHSSGGSGGGGAGVSPELQSNVEVKEISQAFIASGKTVKFEFSKNATPVVNVSFSSEKTAGKTTAIAEMLKGKSTLVSELPSDEIYKSINIWVGSSGFATPKNIKNAVICFKVEKDWLQNNSLDESSIILNRYNDTKWDKLQTSQSGKDDRYIYFTAQTPAFSSFAITGTAAAKEAVNATEFTTPKIGSLEQKNESETSKAEQTPEQTQSSNKSESGGAKTPGFEIVSSVLCLLGVLLYKRRQTE